MRVAVIDVGSNTARLLVANVTGKGTVVPIAEEREYLRLGAEIERTGTLSAKRIAAAASTCGDYARRIEALDVGRATVIVTAPGRQG
ncbi:MAG: exopolyphosphatase, partial [Gaiellaceae bacterium]